MEEIGDAYQALIEKHVLSNRPSVSFFSSVTGKRVTEPDELGPSYWRRNLESPVLFYSAVSAILSEVSQENLFLEIGPHSALAGPLRQIFKNAHMKTTPSYVATLIRGTDGTESLLNTMGQLYTQASR